MPKSKYCKFTSRNGLISLSLMYCQMIRVISSPSSSTTGLVTLIFAMEIGPYLERGLSEWDGNLNGPVRPYSPAVTWVEGEWLRRPAPLLGEAETSFQPAPSLAGGHGADH